LETKGMERRRGFLHKEGRKAAEYLENPLMAIVQIDMDQQC
jgi:hypothetical protein